METTNGKIISTKLGKCVGMLKSASVLTGVMYAIVFLLTIPFYMNRGYNFDSIFIITAAVVIAALIVHFLLNGLYYLVVVLPLVLSAVFFISGWLIWLNVPVIIGPFISLLEVIPFLDVELGWVMEYFTRLGQTSMAIGGAMWWLVKKAKDINYAALYLYLIVLGLLGLISGIINPNLTVLFLIFWGTISYKIHEHPTVDTNNQLAVVFKIVSTLAILIATFKNFSYANNNWYGESSIGIIAYSAFIFLCISFGIWNPKKVFKMVPAVIKPIGGKIYDTIRDSIYLKA